MNAPNRSSSSYFHSRTSNADIRRFVVGPSGRSRHDARCRLRHGNDEGGAATMLDMNGSGGQKMVGFGRYDRPPGSRALGVVASWPGVLKGLRGAIDPAIYVGGSSRFQGAGYECGRTRRDLVFRVRSAQKEVWTLSTLSTSDWPGQRSDCPGFRMFPPLPSVSKARNPVRVPPRARHSPSSEGVFALTCVHSGWSGPSAKGRGVCLAPRVACEVMGERVQGRGWWTLRLL